MQREYSPKPRVVESPEVVLQYEKLKKLGMAIFAQVKTVETGKVDDSDVDLGKKFLQEAAKVISPSVWASFWEHTILAPEMGKRVAQEACRVGIDVDPKITQMGLWLHDVSIMLTTAYNRKDFIGDSLLKKIGIPNEVLSALTSTHKLMVAAEQLNLTDDQSTLRAPLTNDQQGVVDAYFDSLSPTQRITNLADNLGKRTADGLFTMEAFRKYLTTQEKRYDQHSPWPSTHFAIRSSSPGKSPRRPDGAVLQFYTVQKTVEWLEKSGVDLNAIFHELADYGPRFVLVARHGELNNPSNIVYNRDTVMGEEIIHLSEQGVHQMRSIGEVLKKRGFVCRTIMTSPETRTQESSAAIQESIPVPITVNNDLDDSYAPGPFFERMDMKHFMDKQENVYDKKRWGQYNHESLEEIRNRMMGVYRSAIADLKVGEAAVLVTHGDPSATLLDALDPDQNLTLQKGRAAVVVIDADASTVFTVYAL